MYESGKRTGGPARQGQTSLTPVTLRVPEVDATVAVQRSLQAHVYRPVTAQRQVVTPVLTAAALQREEEAQLAGRRGHLQRQAGELGTGLPVDAISQALQRQAELAPAPLPARPQSAADWVGVLQRYAQEHEEKNGTSGLNPREAQQHTALQRQVAQVMAQSLRTDPRPALQRHADFAALAVTLQRHPLTSMVPRAALGMVTPGERPALQRAVDEAVQADILQRAQDSRALELATVQRQLADVDAEASKPVLDRVQARRGSGNPLPEAVRLHLEQGLNHDLSAVRIHDDAEADRLAKGVNAVAFTTGTDIYFQSGRFNPNTQTGLELLAHEVTHTVQQSQGRVGTGIDPDAGLESEARQMGHKLRQTPVHWKGKATRHLPLKASRMMIGALQRQYETPLVFTNSQTKTTLFLGGAGQQWTDASMAAQMAVQALPQRLAQQFSGMPPALMQGTLTMLRDAALVLGASTTLGGLIGAFFGGVGAVPGATIGFEIGQAALTAWGLASVVYTATKQLNVLVASVKTYLDITKVAKGNLARVRAASEALTNGLVVFADGIILAVAALLLKQGAASFAKTRIGQRVGAATASSPAVKWLDARQRMTSTNAAVRAAVNRPGGRGGPALATSGASTSSANSSPRATSSTANDRMTAPSHQAGQTATGGRIRTPVKGLYQGIDTSKAPAGWNFMDSTWTDKGVNVIQTKVSGPGGTRGVFVRGYDPRKKTITLDEAFLENLPKWIDTPGVKLDPGRGIPTTTYLSLYQMRRLGMGFGQARHLKMSTIQNFETILHLEYLKRKGVPVEQAILQTHSVAYAETIAIQSGHQITGAQVDMSGILKGYTVGDLMAFYENKITDAARRAKVQAEHDVMLARYGFTRQETMPMNFDIILDLQPLSPGQVAKPLVTP